MNSMLATLNMRKRTREKLDTNDKGWNSIPLGTVPTINGPKKIQGHSSIAAVDFETNSVGFCLIMASPSESFVCRIFVCDLLLVGDDEPLVEL